MGDIDCVTLLNTPGICLSSILFDVAHTPGDMEGLLFGTVRSETIKTFDDGGDGAEEKKRITINITGSLACGRSFSFYDGKGNVDIIKFIELTKNVPSQNPIGWFRLRSRSVLRPSLRELAVHSALCKHYATSMESKHPESGPFLMGLFTTHLTSDNAIHTYDYRFMQIDENLAINTLKLNIINLMASSKEEYIAFTPTTTPHATLTSMVEEEQPQLAKLESLFSTAVTKLETVVDNVYESTLKLRELQREVAELKNKSKSEDTIQNERLE